VKGFSAAERALVLDFGATSASCGYAGTIVAAHAPFVWPTWLQLVQHYLLDAPRGSLPLVRGGVDTSIPGKQTG
jgi:hypothetical protein